MRAANFFRRYLIFTNTKTVGSPERFKAEKGDKKMKNAAKMFLFGLILVVGFLTAACPERTTIADIEANPSKYYNKQVAIAGTVRDSYGVSVPLTQIRGGIYKIDDGTGSIWVATDRSVPTKGTQIGVKGRIESGVNYNGKNYGLGMQEEDRRFRGK